MNGRLVFRIIVVLLLIAGAVGIGLTAYQAGVAQGLVESGKLVAPAVGAAPFVYGAPGFYRPWGFGFGFLGCLFPLFGLLLFFFLLRGLFWRGGWGGGHRHGERGIPPMFDEWHRKAHTTPTAEAAAKDQG